MLRSVFRVRPSGCLLSHALWPPVPRQSSGRLCVTRGYSSDRPGSSRVGLLIPQSIGCWLRTRISFFLIRAYLDKDFSQKEFTAGATQAFSFVSGMLSQCKFDALENLVASEILKELKEKCSVLPDNYRNALAAESETIHSLPAHVAFHYDGRKSVRILMSFYYRTCADIPHELEATTAFQVIMGNENVKNNKRLLAANYEFFREFTEGVKPDWIITRIEHLNLLR